ncbi:hypothetical protein Psi01_25390 [Planobispora siamensis]|uniref:Histidine kinase/HSP90-like ATPase domain-containing protein n=1 Tax=Planobispora siamensis TaxID=936338 RepID=A0A8J3WIL6_9ACTN|nr:hypothetical protein Psi01_25390 [Planobispora siamensis]
MTDAHHTFPGLPAQVPAARTWATALLPTGHPRRDDLALIVGELAANAVLHTRSGEFAIQIHVTEAAVTVTVTDEGAAASSAPRGAEEEEFGRGLILVAALADDYQEHDGRNGRTVRVRLDRNGGVR